MASFSDRLTGRFYIASRFDRVTMDRIENVAFQLEALINDQETRLQAESSAPMECLYNESHSGLELKGMLELSPPTYLVACNCGYQVAMKDVNEGFCFFGYLK